jgi:hypothetical protein
MIPAKYKETAAAVLSNAHDIIEDEINWCQGQLAMDEYGEKCWYTDPHADMFCAMGAISRACHNMKVPYEIKQMVYDHLTELNDGKRIAEINDVQGHAATLAALNKGLETL